MRIVEVHVTHRTLEQIDERESLPLAVDPATKFVPIVHTGHGVRDPPDVRLALCIEERGNQNLLILAAPFPPHLQKFS